MEGVSGETLQALAEVPLAVLRALASVPVEALERLGSGRREERGDETSPFTGECANGAAAELQGTLERVDQLMRQADVNVVMTFGKWRDPQDQQRTWTWWNGWIDSGGGGITRLLELPGDEVAQAFAVLGSPTRLGILRSLLHAPKSAAELVADLGLGTTGQAYHHLQELIRTGFVEVREKRYHLSGKKMRTYFSALAVAADLVPDRPEERKTAEHEQEQEQG